MGEGGAEPISDLYIRKGRKENMSLSCKIGEGSGSENLSLTCTREKGGMTKYLAQKEKAEGVRTYLRPVQEGRE